MVLVAVARTSCRRLPFHPWNGAPAPCNSTPNANLPHRLRAVSEIARSPVIDFPARSAAAAAYGCWASPQRACRICQVRRSRCGLAFILGKFVKDVNTGSKRDDEPATTAAMPSTLSCSTASSGNWHPTDHRNHRLTAMIVADQCATRQTGAPNSGWF